MRPPQVLKQLRELREAWRRQSFKFTSEQKIQYDNLTKMRHERVKYLHDNGLVFKGGAKKEVDSTK